MKIKLLLVVSLAVVFLAAACKNTKPECEDCVENDLIEATYDPEAYEFDIPNWMPTPSIPADNPMTVEGIALGRMLFYDPILSSDSTMSCFSCHLQEHSFTDALATSQGVLGMNGKRSSMALVNLVFNGKGFFWDGRAESLEEQALFPIEDHLELNETWTNVEEKLQRHDEYPVLFRKAFGIDRKSEITKDLVVKAIAQFERTMISADSRYDQVVWLNNGWFTDAEERGRQLFFFEESQSLDHPGCSHCHFDPLFTDNNYKNNGLDDVGSLEDFPDLGLGGVNNNLYDNGKFRVPGLRNIALTAPYMHDGRFQSLEDVLEHYSSGGHGVENEDVNIRPFPLNDQQKADLIAFLNTLTDTTFINNQAFSNPFK